jgi:hypothetical protein
MTADPFPWEVLIQREVLDAEIAELRNLPPSLWRAVIETPMAKTATGRDGKNYRVTVEAEAKADDGIRVSVTVKPARWGARHPLGRAFSVLRNGRIVMEPEQDSPV